jgi:hypothetical protein
VLNDRVALPTVGDIGIGKPPVYNWLKTGPKLHLPPVTRLTLNPRGCRIEGLGIEYP